MTSSPMKQIVSFRYLRSSISTIIATFTKSNEELKLNNGSYHYTYTIIIIMIVVWVVSSTIANYMYVMR